MALDTQIRVTLNSNFIGSPSPRDLRVITQAFQALGSTPSTHTSAAVANKPVINGETVIQAAQKNTCVPRPDKSH